MTANEMTKQIGASGEIKFGSIGVHVVIMDAKLSYGQIRYNVSPVNGTGSAWVNASSIRIFGQAAL